MNTVINIFPLYMMCEDPDLQFICPYLFKMTIEFQHGYYDKKI
jgi:hypothetical protein